MSDTVQWLAEITYIDPSTLSAAKLYYTNGAGFITRASDTPANQFYDARIKSAVNVTRSLFTGAATQGASRIGFGELVLLNGDGGLDGLIAYGFDGQAIRILRSEALTPVYSDFSVVLVGTMEQPEFQADVVRIKVRDNQFSLNVPLQPTKYTGAGLGTLEGVAGDLKGKPKPVLYGAVSNISPPCVETAKLIYQVSEGLVSSVIAVYDRGLAMGFGFPPLTTSAGVGAQGMATNGSVLVAVSGGTIKVWNGTSWTTATHPALPAGGVFEDAVYWSAGAMFVVVGLGGTIMTSPDAVAWTDRSSGTNNWGSVAAGPSRVVVCGQDSTSTSPRISSSSDGITFTARTTPWVTGLGRGAGEADYGNGKYMIAGNPGTSTAVELATSTDGDTWTLVTVSGFSSVGSGGTTLRYLNGLWLLGTGGGDIATSVNGVEFGVHRSALADTNGFAYVNGTYYSGSANSGAIASSTDGSNWVQVKGATSSVVTTLAMVALSGRLYVAGLSDIYVTQGSSGTYATSADLLDDTLAPVAGTYKTFLDASGSYFRLGATPAGTITCDATQGAAAANRTAAQIFKLLLARQSITPNASDITALDTANSAVLGYWSDVIETTVADVCDLVINSVGAWWGVDKSGTFRTAQFTTPTNSPVISWTPNDLNGPVARLSTSDPGRGVPIYRSIVRWGKNYTVQTSDIAAAVTQDRRTYLEQEYREAKATDATVQTLHVLAQELAEDSLLTTETDAQAEATRRLTLRKSRRDHLQTVPQFTTENAAVDLGNTVEIINARIGARLVGYDPTVDQIKTRYVIIGIASNAENKKLTVDLWGPSNEQMNRVTSTGAYRLTSDGKYRVTAAG